MRPRSGFGGNLIISSVSAVGKEVYQGPGSIGKKDVARVLHWCLETLSCSRKLPSLGVRALWWYRGSGAGPVPPARNKEVRSQAFALLCPVESLFPLTRSRRRLASVRGASTHA